ncbi:MAG: Glutamate synthase [NADPH] small chain [Myxococcota bacterium]|nr:Glutamate synthase [NADPH] small chain [Myxococcota bacterium]
MAKPTGFMEFTREDPPKRPVEERIRDFREFEGYLPHGRLIQQASRCMDCGVPFCHAHGCPTENRIPEWIDQVRMERWRDALDLLHSTDNFPEFTGRVCPAPCENACTLGINQPAVTIRHIELQIIERGWREGWVTPRPAGEHTGLKAAVVGSGPAGLACAQELARRGHAVTVFERDDRVGGLLRYGIPDFKLEKHVIDRRLRQMEAEGVVFETGVDVGVDLSSRYLMRSFDAVALTIGAMIPRPVDAAGRALAGVHYAMEYLTQQNRRTAGDREPPSGIINAAGKRVVVIGGGDTGSDCIGTAHRQGAASVSQLEILPRPPDSRAPDNPWPTWAKVLRASHSHEEGCERYWNISTKEFLGENGQVTALRCARVEWTPSAGGRMELKDVPGGELILPADLVLIAAGFTGPALGSLRQELNLALSPGGTVRVDSQMMTSTPGVFAAGDCVIGASLVVRALHQGRVMGQRMHDWLLRQDSRSAAAE